MNDGHCQTGPLDSLMIPVTNGYIRGGQSDWDDKNLEAQFSPQSTLLTSNSV